MLLSIIIPVYNAARYLRQALDSVLSQSFKDYEIILINDGSTDDSLDILEEYAKNSSARIINKANEGVSAARNRGILEAKGKYLFFMDADDLLHPDFLSLMTGIATNNKAEIVVCDYTTFYSKPKYAHIPKGLEAKRVDNDTKQAFDTLADKGRATSLCNKLFPNLLQGGHPPIFLDEKMSFGEDMFFCWKYLLITQDVFLIEAPLYLYRQTSSGATTRYHDKLYENYRRASEDIESFAESNGLLASPIHQSVVYHLTRRLPALTSMENRAPYSFDEKVYHLGKVIDDELIQEGLTVFATELTAPLYEFARNKNCAAMLKYVKRNELKRRLLFPIKRLVK